MAVRIVPFSPRMEMINRRIVQTGTQLMEVISVSHNYNNAVHGDTFLVDHSSSREGYWEDAVPFQATLEILSMDMKNKVTVIDRATNRSYRLMPNDFFRMTQVAAIHEGKVTGTFDFVKKGSAFGIVYVS